MKTTTAAVRWIQSRNLVSDFCSKTRLAYLMNSSLIWSFLLDASTENDKQRECMRSWAPTIYFRAGREVYNFLGQEITIQESIDSYGATIWPAALALCRFLETPQGHQHIDLLDKSVLELGAGTGLLSVVVTLLGAKLTATDLPEILSNLTYNLNRNTRGRRRHEPLVAELYWGHKLDEFFPRSTHQYDYVLATDVVYHHNFLAELLVTMRHLCQPGTILVWANKVRYASDLGFIDNFLRYFEITLLEDQVKIFTPRTWITAIMAFACCLQRCVLFSTSMITLQVVIGDLVFPIFTFNHINCALTFHFRYHETHDTA
uniref:Si:ch73-244f7.3 n=1 Tax=Sinocyclocheilus rhinocerous TaxID=307959 RepID=A0A673LZ90_9TELE